MEVFEESDTDASGAITYKEWEAMTSIPGIAEKFRRLGFEGDDLQDLFTVLDADQEGTLMLDEFVKGIVRLMTDIRPKDILVTQSIIKRLHRDMSKDFQKGLKKAFASLGSVGKDVLTHNHTSHLPQPDALSPLGPPVLMVSANTEPRLKGFEEGQERLAAHLKKIYEDLDRLLPVQGQGQNRVTALPGDKIVWGAPAGRAWASTVPSAKSPALVCIPPRGHVSSRTGAVDPAEAIANNPIGLPG